MRKGRKWTEAQKNHMRAKMLAKHGKRLVPIKEVLNGPGYAMVNIGSAGGGGGGGGGGSSSSSSAKPEMVPDHKIKLVNMVRALKRDNVIGADEALYLIGQVLK